MKIRLISDLHIDINERYPLDLHENGSNDVFTLIAGDVSGYPKMTIEWIKHNVHQGAFICGNHDAYDSMYTIEDIKDMYHREFPENGNVAFFDNDVGAISKEIADGILLVADVMYTDYALPIRPDNPKGDERVNMDLADPYVSRNRSGMNDFNYGRCKKAIGEHAFEMLEPGVFRLTPENYLAHHRRAFAKITKTIEQNKDKQIILMAHHGLSPQCLDSNYDAGNLAASYVSDKESWIKDHPNIKLVFSGHIHCRKIFNVGSTLYAMNSCGYCRRHLKQIDAKTGKMESWTPDCFLDTSNWTVEWHHSTNDAWDKQYAKDNAMMKHNLAAFII